MNTIVRIGTIAGISAMMLCFAASLLFAHPGHKNKGEHIHLNLNTASQGEIARAINAIAEIDLCHEITGYRMAHDGFKSIDELKKVNGVSEEVFKKITEHITLEV